MLTGVIDRPERVLYGVVGLSPASLVLDDSCFVVLTIVFGVVVELESDSFSKLPTSSLSF